jgi:crotonobetainyl-CoA:carnitine CoA-transferase CaiB-like acyl-CoA transferase
MSLLSGLHVLDLSRLLPGPYCTMLLADQGADVVKVEDPVSGDYARYTEPFVNGVSLVFEMLNRGKRSLALDLKADAGRKAFLRLARDVDVVLENFRPGVVDRLGIGYSEVAAVNSQIVYCSLSGFGQTGPRRNRAGHDLNYIALAGILDMNRRPNEAPVVPGIQYSDMTGGLMAALGIMLALWNRAQTGDGRYIDVAMFDATLGSLVMPAASVLAGQVSEPMGHPFLGGRLPCYNVYATSDGSYMTLAALEPKFWHNFCTAVNRDDLLDQGYAPAAIPAVRDIFASRTQNEWVEHFQDVDACCEPMQDLAETLRDPQVRARDMVVDTKHPAAGSLRQLGAPFKFSSEPTRSLSPAPGWGEHTREVLGAAGFSPSEVTALCDQGVVRESQ